MTTTLTGRQRRRQNRPDGYQPKASSFRSRLNAWDVKFSPYLYISPFFLLFIAIGLFPLVYTFVVSINDWNLLTGRGDWVGFKNYATEFKDPFFWKSVWNTFSIFLLSAIPQLIAATAIAAVLDRNLRAKTFWRLSVMLPYIVTPVAVALIFSRVFSEQYGLANNLLEHLGMSPIMWKTEVLPAHLAIATMVNWRWTGYNALILLAAMQAVPRDIYESASIDGAGAVRRFFSITVPMIRPTMIFVIVTMTVGGLQIFTEPKLLNPSSSVLGGPQRQYETVVLYIWDLAFNRQNFGRAATVAWLLFIIIVAVGTLNFLLSRRIASAEGARENRRTQRRQARILAQRREADRSAATLGARSNTTGGER